MFAWKYQRISKYIFSLSQVAPAPYTPTFEGIIGPLSHMCPNLGLDRLWGLKNRFFLILI